MTGKLEKPVFQIRKMTVFDLPSVICFDYPEYSVSQDGKVFNKKGQELRQYVDRHGYVNVELWKGNKKKTVRVHRLVATAFIANPNNYPFVDHRDRNTINNHYSNLRWCTHQQNQTNRDKTRNNKSGYRGVCWDKDKRKYRAHIRVHGKRIHLGYFDNPENASKAHEEARLKYFPDF